MENKGTTILKHFDNVFDTETLQNFKHINFYKMKMLKKFYEYFEEELYTPSEKYEELRKKHLEIADNLEKTFTKEQQKLFEEYWDLSHQMTGEEQEQVFLFGFILSKEFELEQKVS